MSFVNDPCDPPCSFMHFECWQGWQGSYSKLCMHDGLDDWSCTQKTALNQLQLVWSISDKQSEDWFHAKLDRESSKFFARSLQFVFHGCWSYWFDCSCTGKRRNAVWSAQNCVAIQTFFNHFQASAKWWVLQYRYCFWVWAKARCMAW